MHCGHEGFTIRGQCEACAPGLHVEHHARLARYAEAAAAFRRETGLDPMQAWESFDAWMEWR